MATRVKGTQDFLDLTLYNFIIEKAREHLGVYSYTEIATPIIEHTALFERSLGEHTDVVSKEMFLIQPRAESKDQLCLRPEATASTVRAFVDNKIATTPWKVFSHGPMFRYERPQKGRYRQFHQLSIECIGASSGASDAQFITMLDRFFHETLQSKNYALLINFLGCDDDRKAYQSALKTFLTTVDAQICDTCKVRKEHNIMRIFDCKNPECAVVYRDAPHIAECLCPACAVEWQTLKEQLELLSVSYTYRPMLVRGLDYYNKTVFEFVSNDLGAQNAFCGGGRYDKLVGWLGAKKDQPSLGAAIGLERLMLVLENNKDILPIPQPKPLHAILPVSPEQHTLALLLADVLHANTLTTQVFLDGDSLKSMMRKANKLGAAYCLILGEDEQHAKTVTVKNMGSGQTDTIPQIEAVKFLQ